MEKKFLILLTYVVIWTHTALLVCGEERGIKQADDTGKYLDEMSISYVFFLFTMYYIARVYHERIHFKDHRANTNTFGRNKRWSYQ